MSISGSWGNAVNYAEVGLLLSLDSWAVMRIGRGIELMIIGASSKMLSLFHLGVVSVKTLICVLDNEGILQSDAGWADKSRLLLIIISLLAWTLKFV